jgi:hypothetical protein
MELKDVILSTLAEMEEDTPLEKVEDIEENKEPAREVLKEDLPQQTHKQMKQSTTESELLYLNSIRERLLVLFEGFQAPNNSNIEAKVDMTLNFLEYTLATIDERVEKLQRGAL